MHRAQSKLPSQLGFGPICSSRASESKNEWRHIWSCRNPIKQTYKEKSKIPSFPVVKIQLVYHQSVSEDSEGVYHSSTLSALGAANFGPKSRLRPPSCRLSTPDIGRTLWFLASLPEELSQLKKLETLNIQHNHLSSLPKSIGKIIHELSYLGDIVRRLNNSN